MWKALVTLLLCIFVVTLGWGVVKVAAMVRKPQTEDGVAAAAVAEKARIPAVKVQTLKGVSLEDRLVLTGGIEPWERITISAETPGLLEFQGFEEGETVKAGQELFRIDTKTIQTNMDTARAQMKLAEQDFERAQLLTKEGMGTTQALDNARTGKDVASATIRFLEIRLSKSFVKAPFDGVVDKIFKKRGEYTDMAAALIRLVQVYKVKAVAGIPERDVPYFKLGDKVTVLVDAFGERTFQGAVYRLAPTAEAATRTFPAEIELDNADGQLRPGMVARVKFVRKTYPDAILVPIFTVLTLDDKRLAAVEEGGKAHVRLIEVGILQGNEVQVTRGLSAGDRLIVMGQRDIKDGEPVEVQEVLQ